MFSEIYGNIIASKAPPTFSFCPLLNESICPSTSVSSGVIPVVVYNPLAWPITDYVKFPTNTSSVSVVDSNNNPIPVQVLPGITADTYHAVFPATVVGFGFTTYFVTLGSATEYTEMASVETPTADITMSNKYLTVNMDAYGNLQSVVTAMGQTVPLTQTYQFYFPNIGANHTQASGAYLWHLSSFSKYRV
eukprot:Phypoly_transcript_14428.p1 GENE.Phypoly_transcript_14428~~Phypoly_transcript_14428.p1  ORF type:complete len:191 (+),score=29.13 Phypoly_transcript_14428:237-809(+)